MVQTSRMLRVNQMIQTSFLTQRLILLVLHHRAHQARGPRVPLLLLMKRHGLQSLPSLPFVLVGSVKVRCGLELANSHRNIQVVQSHRGRPLATECIITSPKSQSAESPVALGSRALRIFASASWGGGVTKHPRLARPIWLQCCQMRRICLPLQNLMRWSWSHEWLCSASEQQGSWLISMYWFIVIRDCQRHLHFWGLVVALRLFLACCSIAQQAPIEFTSHVAALASHGKHLCALRARQAR